MVRVPCLARNALYFGESSQDLILDFPQAHGRIARDGQRGSNGHGEILGECQGFEKPSLLRFQSEV